VLIRPALVRRLVLAATGPKGAPGMHGWREDVSQLLASLIPDAQIRISDAAHGFLFQYPTEVAAEINQFLAGDDENMPSSPSM